MEEEGDERGMSVGEHEREKEREEEEAIGREAIESAIDAIGKSCVLSSWSIEDKGRCFDNVDFLVTRYDLYDVV